MNNKVYVVWFNYDVAYEDPMMRFAIESLDKAIEHCHLDSEKYGFEIEYYIIEEWENRENSTTYIWNKLKKKFVKAQFNEEHLEYEEIK